MQLRHILLALGLVASGLQNDVTAQDTLGIPSDSAAIRAATEAANKWLALLDNGLYTESWDSAASAFRQVVSKPDWEKSVSNARAPFEPFKSRGLISARRERNLPNAPPGDYVILQYQATVAGARTVVETVVPMVDTDGFWRVGGYFVRPQ